MKNIGDRMKDNYENRNRYYLTRRIPVIMRLDGKAFHTLLKRADKPFDDDFRECMETTAMYICRNIQGTKCGYIQSDEISLLLTDFDKLDTEGWFDYNVQKMTSIASAIASVFFSTLTVYKTAFFDCRVFNIPKEEVTNYFIWRQKDWVRNSIQMLAQSHFSHKQLHKKNSSDMHEMLHGKEINWADLENKWKNGSFIKKEDKEWGVIIPCPIFTKNREIIEDLMIPIEE